MKIRTGDLVVVITGKDKGRTGQVLRLLPGQGRVVVAGINMRTKHLKKTPQRAGQIIRYEASIHMSNVMLVDPKSKKRTRVGFLLEGGRKRRIAKRSKTALEAGKARPPKGAAKAAPTEAKTPAKETPVAEVPKKQPFWKRMGFGAQALEEAEAQKPAGDDHSSGTGAVPITRSTGRGS